MTIRDVTSAWGNVILRAAKHLASTMSNYRVYHLAGMAATMLQCLCMRTLITYPERIDDGHTGTDRADEHERFKRRRYIFCTGFLSGGCHSRSSTAGRYQRAFRDGQSR